MLSKVLSGLIVALTVGIGLLVTTVGATVVSLAARHFTLTSPAAIAMGIVVTVCGIWWLCTAPATMIRQQRQNPDTTFDQH